ncbi:KEOPS complex component [Halobacteriales archaeon QS_3_64_16]|nr:MAG: KEOPS complex component [Halobacteriales archaeon QS_3_64_16]
MELVEGVGEIEDVDRLIEQLDEIGQEHGCVVTAFDARYLTGREHLTRATSLADRAFERSENVADARAIEVLLYVAGRRQIDRALEIGVSAGEGPIVVAIEQGNNERNGGKSGGDDREQEGAAAVERALAPDFEHGEKLGEYDEALVQDFFEISERELGATDAGLAELVVERVALLDVEK